MICVVEERGSGRTVPACATIVEEGMIIETNTTAIRNARREVLQLLLSEHAGDCEAPCRRACPASMDIPLMLRRIAKGDMDTAARIAARDLVLPATLGCVCEAPCETACRRAGLDEAVSIRALHRAVAEAAHGMRLDCQPSTGKRVAVIGAGPAGLGAAVALRRFGHGCCVYEKRAHAGGALRDMPESRLPRAILEMEIDAIRRMDVAFRFGVDVGAAIPLTSLVNEHDAVIVASGGIEAQGEAVFAAPEHRMTVRAIAAGKRAAEAAHRRIALGGSAEPAKPYDAHLGRLEPEQLERYAGNRVAPEALARSRQSENLRGEAGRCLHCDCHAPVSCKLRQYATEYGARPATYRAPARPEVGVTQRHGGVLFDPGKCIKCGLCVEITHQSGEALGLTFVGRGFATRVAVPFNESIEAALRVSAEACVAACPTGALAFADTEERRPCE